MKTNKKGITLSRVQSAIGLCAAGCGTRTKNGVCSICARHDPEVVREQVREQRLHDVRMLARSGADVTGTCAGCANWRNRCLMGIPECSVKWAKKCSCFLPVEVAA